MPTHTTSAPSLVSRSRYGSRFSRRYARSHAFVPSGCARKASSAMPSQTPIMITTTSGSYWSSC